MRHQSADLTKTEEAEQAAEKESNSDMQEMRNLALQIDHIIMQFKQDDEEVPAAAADNITDV